MLLFKLEFLNMDNSCYQFRQQSMLDCSISHYFKSLSFCGSPIIDSILFMKNSQVFGHKDWNLLCIRVILGILILLLLKAKSII